MRKNKLNRSKTSVVTFYEISPSAQTCSEVYNNSEKIVNGEN